MKLPSHHGFDGRKIFDDAPGDLTAAGEVNLSAWDSRLFDSGGRTAGQSHTIVEFDGNPTENRNLRAPAPTNGAYPYPARYTTETVTINLKTVTELLGQPVQIP